MRISYIEAKNFKSFKHLSVQLKDLNILIGPNASGKTNFVELIKFLKDIIDYDLNNAISLQGGAEYIKNIIINENEPISFKIVLDNFRKRDDVLGKKIGLLSTKKLFLQANIEFSLLIDNETGEYLIQKDQIILSEYPKHQLELESEQPFNNNAVIDIIKIWNNNGKIEYEQTNSTKKSKHVIISLMKELFQPFQESLDVTKGTLLIKHPAIQFFLTLLGIDLSNKIAIFNFEPRKAKYAVPIPGKSELENDGSNLTIVLKKILENSKQRDKLYRLVSNILPFVENIEISKIEDKSLMLKVQEQYTQNKLIPAFLISDGTIHVTELIIALYFDEHQIVIIEEPERNIHPYLISKIVRLLEDVSHRKQVIVTTHNPELIKFVNIGNILLTFRDKEGFSKITSPQNIDTVIQYLEGGIGIDQLFIDNLLGE